MTELLQTVPPNADLRPAPDKPIAPDRLTSIDAYRGLVMLLMMAEVLHLHDVAKALPINTFWGQFWHFLSWHQTHVEWVGCTLHDLIQPSFSLLVGVALPFSIASRLARGQSKLQMSAHAFWRAVILVALGVFLRSTSRPQTYFTFEDTLSQIGLGYGFLFLLGFRPVRDQWIALGVVLAAYWTAFVWYPLPDSPLDYEKIGVSAQWFREHGLNGLAAHWNKNTNLAWAFDTSFLNLFPREKPFENNGGGYATLSFIPTLATMILGLIAGETLRSMKPAAAKFRWLLVVGLAMLAGGWLLDWFGVCPIVKRIWTPSWVLFSGGWCYLLLAGFFGVMEIVGWRAWAFPLRVIGMNSIAAYCMVHLFESFIFRALPTHLGHKIFESLGDAYEPLLHGAAVLLTLWLILLWMYRRKIFLRI